MASRSQLQLNAPQPSTPMDTEKKDRTEGYKTYHFICPWVPLTLSSQNPPGTKGLINFKSYK